MLQKPTQSDVAMAKKCREFRRRYLGQALDASTWTAAGVAVWPALGLCWFFDIIESYVSCSLGSLAS